MKCFQIDFDILILLLLNQFVINQATSEANEKGKKMIHLSIEERPV